MEKLIITIETVNSAFEDYTEQEVARILRELADKIEAGRQPESINDMNGHPVCEVEYINE